MFETSSDERGDWETWMGYSSGPRRAAIAAGLWSAAQRDIIRPLSKYKTMFSSSLLLPQFTVNGTRVIILMYADKTEVVHETVLYYLQYL